MENKFSIIKFDNSFKNVELVLYRGLTLVEALEKIKNINLSYIHDEYLEDDNFKFKLY